jgi:hemerythrin-like metal-binding protein
METLEWNADYATGIPEIDAQHSYLFELTNRFIRSLHGQPEPAALQQIIAELEDYTQKHFTFEEKCMAEARYPHLEEHRQSHQRLREQIARFRSELAGGQIDPHELADFLRNWLTLHVLREDMRYIPTLTARGELNGNS